MLSVILYLFGFLRTLLVIVIIYLVIRYIRTLISPPKSNTQNRSNTNSSSKEGETTIRYSPKGDKIINKDKGEYVDFEEVD